MADLDDLRNAIYDDDFDTFKSQLSQIDSYDDAYVLVVEASKLQARERYISALMEANFPVTNEGPGGAPPAIFTAIKCQNKAALTTLVEAKANLEDVRRDYTPLTWAVECRTYACAKYLVDAGASLNPPGLKSALEILQEHCEAQLIPQSDVPVWMELCANPDTLATRGAGGEAVAKALNAALMEGSCTFSVTNENFIEHPEYFECKTCELFVCGSCRTSCHSAHKLTKYAKGEMYCDCGANTYNSLINPSVRLTSPKCACLPKVATTADLADYKTALNIALLDKEITPEEDAFLSKLRKDRGIAQVQHEKILAEFNLTKEAFALMYAKTKPSPAASASTAITQQASAAFIEDPEIDMKVQRKFALIIANSNYREVGASLKNPVNDAKAIHDVLTRCGFDVSLHLDVPDKPAFESIVKKYVEKLQRHSGETCVSLCFYAGHAIEILGFNYFLHCNYTNDQLAREGYSNVNASTADKSIMSSFYPAQTLTETLSENCTTNIIILDACRNNPFKPPKTAAPALASKGSKSGAGSQAVKPSQGISAMYPQGQALMVLAAAPGFTAADGSAENKDNGLFTQALLQFLTNPSLHVEDVIFHTKRRVQILSGGKQQPWVHSALVNRVYLARP